MKWLALAGIAFAMHLTGDPKVFILLLPISFFMMCAS